MSPPLLAASGRELPPIRARTLVMFTIDPPAARSGVLGPSGVGNRHRGALHREHPGDRFPDSPAAAGDEHDLVDELHSYRDLAQSRWLLLAEKRGNRETRERGHPVRASARFL